MGQRDLFRQGSYYRPGVSSNQNISAHFYQNTWRPDRPDAEYPRLSANADVTAYNYRASALTIRNNRYARLKNAVLGYTLPAALLRPARLSNLRVYLSGENLWETAGIRDGFDPEVSDEPDALPFNRSWAVGLTASF
ncbi:MAG: hypothetical protein H7Z21_04935 [Hymenobacter sp.]|nr:hypothetical protein [Hymenobacter sp.]